jgi:hypothetical protein
VGVERRFCGTGNLLEKYTLMGRENTIT